MSGAPRAILWHGPSIVLRTMRQTLALFVRRFHLSALPALLVLAGGCGSAPEYHLVPVEGTLLYRDHPVKMAAIQLVPDEDSASSRPSAAGMTDADGHFTLASPPHGAGAAPGAYKAFIAGYGASSLPQRYTNPKTGLTVVVPEEGLTELKLTLVD